VQDSKVALAVANGAGGQPARPSPEEKTVEFLENGGIGGGCHWPRGCDGPAGNVATCTSIFSGIAPFMRVRVERRAA
jgi:hypothetical protein